MRVFSKMIDWDVENGVILGTAVTSEDKVTTDMLSENATFDILEHFEDDAQPILQTINHRFSLLNLLKDAGEPSIWLKRIFATAANN